MMYVDMYAFFASIEQLYNPELCGRPLAVVSHYSPTGTVLASSYEAKRLGIDTGTKLKDAQAACADLALRETNGALYKAVHQQIRTLLIDTLGPETEMRSIDEATVRLAPDQIGQAHALAAVVNARIAARIGPSLKCSIGITPNSLLAKLSLTDFPGIAEGNVSLLISRGIRSPLEFYEAQADRLRAEFGIWGQYWWWHLHGFEVPAQETRSRSLSHEQVLHKWIYSKAEARPLLTLTADRVVHRMRRNGYRCRTLQLSLSFVGLPRHTLERRFDAPVGSYAELLGGVTLLSERLPAKFPAAVRKLSIVLNEVVATDADQLDLFRTNEPSIALATAIQKIRKRHGMQIIGPGISIRKNPLDPIKKQPGFGRIRDSVIY